MCVGGGGGEGAGSSNNNKSLLKQLTSILPKNQADGDK